MVLGAGVGGKVVGEEVGRGGWVAGEWSWGVCSCVRVEHWCWFDVEIRVGGELVEMVVVVSRRRWV